MKKYHLFIVCLLLGFNLEGMQKTRKSSVKKRLRIATDQHHEAEHDSRENDLNDLEREVDPIVNDEENMHTMEEIIYLLQNEAVRNEAFRDEIARQQHSKTNSNDLKDMFMMKLMSNLINDKKEKTESYDQNKPQKEIQEKSSLEDMILETMEAWTFRGSWLISNTAGGIVKYSPTIVKFILWSAVCYFLVDMISNFSDFSLTFLTKLDLILDKAVTFSGNILEAGGNIAQSTASIAGSSAHIANSTAHVANIAGTGAQAISNSYVISYFLPAWVVTAGTGFAANYFVPLIQAVRGN